MPKKKQDLSPEKRLAAALVPEEEWPYALPDGWKWVYLGKITTIVGGGTPSSRCPEYYDDGGIPWITPADLSDYNEVYISHGRRNITQLGLEKSSAKLMPENTVLLSSRAPIGYVAIAANDICTNQGFKSFLPSIHFIPEYLYWFLKGNQSLLQQYASGTTFLELSSRRASEIKFPIAPLSEQRRLVARIESLFAKLDAAREKVQSVLDSHETRKAALLHDAFTGKLTARWQEEHNLSYNEWHLVYIKDICHSLKYGTAKKSEASGRYVVIRMGNLFDGEILWDNLAYSNDSEDIEKYQLTPGDVLFNRTNSAALVGKTSIYRGDYPAIYAGYIIKLDYDRQAIDGEFLNYVMNSPCAKAYCNKVKTDGVNQSNINAKKIGAFQFKLPSLPEQQEIVRILDRLLAREQRARQAAEETLAAIDRMKQSILARAFRGEL